ncbi:MAG: hypothetical protein ACOX0E_06545 [Syntrophomonadaceae bacterium]|jgi:hypothetical protein
MIIQSELRCNESIDYTPVVVNDKRLPFVIQLDVGLSNLNPQEGENQRFCYRITGKGQDNDEYADLSH